MPKKPKTVAGKSATATATATGNGKRHATQQSVNSAIKSICDVMRRSNCAGAMKYVPELTWLLFLRILDERETHEADEAEALGIPFTLTIKKPCRWRDWAAPGCALRQDTKASVWKFEQEQVSVLTFDTLWQRTAVKAARRKKAKSSGLKAKGRKRSVERGVRKLDLRL